jgi:hypothetical protein
LRRRAAVGFAGPQPIGWHEIDAFLRRSGTFLAPWEIEIIERIDDIYLQPSTQQPTPPDGQAVAALASPGDAAAVRSILGSVGNRRTVRRKKG